MLSRVLEPEAMDTAEQRNHPRCGRVRPGLPCSRPADRKRLAADFPMPQVMLAAAPSAPTPCPNLARTSRPQLHAVHDIDSARCPKDHRCRDRQ